MDDGIGNKWFVDIDYSVGEGAEAGGGNYWERWKEEDVDNDGIIDTPYALDGKGDGAIDRLPLEDPVPLVERQAVVPEFGAIVPLVLFLAVSGIIVSTKIKSRLV
jgi:hypothetical protein